MKIYEIRDISDDEMYFVKGFFSDKETAIKNASSDDSHDVSDNDEDWVRLAVYEYEVDAFPWDSEGKKVLEVLFTKEYQEDSDDDKWVKEITMNQAAYETGVQKGDEK